MNKSLEKLLDDFEIIRSRQVYSEKILNNFRKNSKETSGEFGKILGES